MWVDPTVVSNNYGLRLAKYGLLKGIPTVVPGFNPREWLADHPDHIINWYIHNQVSPFQLRVAINNLGYLTYLDSYYLTHSLKQIPSDYNDVATSSSESSDCEKVRRVKVCSSSDSLPELPMTVPELPMSVPELPMTVPVKPKPQIVNLRVNSTSLTLELPFDCRIYINRYKRVNENKPIDAKIGLHIIYAPFRRGYRDYYDSSFHPQTLDYSIMNSMGITKYCRFDNIVSLIH